MLEARLMRHGAPSEVIELVEAPDPGEPGPGEVRVRVLASPIDPMDLLIARGLYPLLPELPAVPGAEGVGRVESIGDGVCGLEIGDVVLLPIRAGAWRELGHFEAADLVRLPADADLVQSSMLRVNALTAHALLDESGVGDGDVVLLSPGRGGVSQYVQQLAERRGAAVVRLVSESAVGEPSWPEGPWLQRDRIARPTREQLRDRGARFAFDGSGGAATALLASCLVDGGSVVTYGAMSRKSPTMALPELVFRGVSLRGFWLKRWTEQRGAGAVASALQLLAGFELSCRVHARVPLKNLSEALLEAGSVRDGRVVLLPVRTTA